MSTNSALKSALLHIQVCMEICRFDSETKDKAKRRMDKAMGQIDLLHVMQLIDIDEWENLQKLAMNAYINRDCK